MESLLNDPNKKPNEPYLLSVVGHLANLFWKMEHYQTASITPAIELANLALLTSKDEEDEKSDKGGMDLSNNALLAGDALSRFPIFESSNSKKPQSVLGKCQRDDSEFIVESPEKDSSKTGPQSRTPSRSGTSLPLEQARPSELSRMTTLVPLNGDDVTIGDSRIEEDPSQKVISLPVRSAEALEPVRMFGKCHSLTIKLADLVFGQASSTMSSNAWTIACSRLRLPCSSLMRAEMSQMTSQT